MCVSYVCMKTDQRRASAEATTAVAENLVEATSRIIQQKGPAAATSRAIAEAAGENLGSITYYFGSKEALVGEALARAARDLMGPVLEVLTGDRPHVEKLLASVQMLDSILAKNRHNLAGYTQFLAASTHNDPVGDEIRTLHRELRALLAAEMEAQQASGLIPQWVRPEAMTDLIVSLVNGVVVGAAVSPTETDPAAIGQQFAALLVAVAQNEQPS